MNNKKENKVLNKIKWIATRGIFIVAYIGCTEYLYSLTI